MTAPTKSPRSAATDTTVFLQTADAPTVTRLPIPGNVYVVHPGEGSADAVVCSYDILNADAVTANPVVPTWSSPGLVLASYGLEPAHETAIRLLAEVFGPDAALTAVIERSEETLAPELVFQVEIPRAARGRRSRFVARYSSEVVIPPLAPVPVLQWIYRDAIPA